MNLSDTLCLLFARRGCYEGKLILSFERAEVTQNNSVRCHGNAAKNCVHAAPEKAVNLLEDELQSIFFAQPRQRMFVELQLQTKATNDSHVFVSLYRRLVVNPSNRFSFGAKLISCYVKGSHGSCPHFMNENKLAIFSERCFLPVALEAFCVRKVGCAETLTRVHQRWKVQN